MEQTDHRFRWPEKIKWIRRQLRESPYVWDEATHGPLHLAYHPGGFLRIEMAYGPGDVFQHTLFSMQIQASWSREDTVNRARAALVAMGLVAPAETPKVEPP